MKKNIRTLVQRLGFDVIRYADPVQREIDALYDFSEEQKEIILRAKPFTMTSVARMVSLINAVEYVSLHKIPGDIVECGVWRGGSMMTAALTLLRLGDTERELFLYDTFEGMSKPTDADSSLDGASASELLETTEKGTGVWCYASIEDVRENILSLGYPSDKIHLVKGKVEDTIPSRLPRSISLLRLDTDWYESTKHELEHLYPLLVRGGVLIIDDYGHWQGARKAVDEYFAGKPMYLHRADYTGRVAIKND